MKKNSISYNNILPKKRSDIQQKTNDANQSSKSDMDLQSLLKKHVIFKSKVPAKSEKSPNKSKSPINLKTRKRNLTKPEDEYDNQMDTIKKRYKLKAIDMFENSFDGSDSDIDIFEMPNDNKQKKSPTINKQPVAKKKMKIEMNIDDDSDDLFTNNITNNKNNTLKDVKETIGTKPLNKENIEISKKKTPVTIPSKSKKSVSPKEEAKEEENPYKKVYPPKKLRLRLNTSIEEDDFNLKDIKPKINETNSSPIKIQNLKIESPSKNPKKINDEIIEIKSEKCTKTKQQQTVPSEKDQKKFSIKINPTDLSDEDFDEFDTKMIVIKKSNTVAENQPVKTELKKIFSAKFYDNLDSDDDELSEKIYKKTILKRKVIGTDLETSPTNKISESPETSNKRKIFSSKRHNEDSKSLKMFNLNPNTEDINFKVETKESLNEAVCIFDSNSSRSNSPIITSNFNTNACVSIQKKFHAYEKEYDSTDTKQKILALSRKGSSEPSQDSNEAFEIEIQLRNSRKAYECEELGENQAFLDDMEYLFDGLSSEYKLNDRCLCAIKLAESCLSSEFRMNLRLSNEYINRIFTSLSDAVNYQSLALCTALIMFALTQDKLIMNINKETFHLIISIINMKISLPTKKTTPIQKPKKYATRRQYEKIFNYSQEKIECTNIENESSDHELYQKLINRCKILTGKLVWLGNDKKITEEDEFNKHQIFFTSASLDSSFKDEEIQKSTSSNDLDDFSHKLLAIECLFSMNINKQHNVPVEWYKNELRELGVFDQILDSLKSTFIAIKQSKGLKTCPFFFNKYLRYFNFLECVMQSSTSALASFTMITETKGNKVKSITADETEIGTSIPVAVLNQNYLVEFGNRHLLNLIQESLEYFYGELLSLKQQKLPGDSKQNLITDSIKVNLLFMINITHNNEKVSRIIANNDGLISLIFKCISNIVHFLEKEEQFDLLIMSMSILLNIYDSITNSKVLNQMLEGKEFQNISSYDIIIELYKNKENLVSLAENDQDSEFKNLAEQLESQNEENINKAIMNSIHKAGVHMEDHLIAAYSALLIGHILQNKKDIVNEVKLRMKDNSFKYMALIIRKFLVFMKIMNVNGFSADQNVNRIIKFLENT